MLVVHHLGNSQSERIVWLCEELGISYELRRYEREPSMAAPPAYRALHPCGTAPIITDGSLALGETGAIMEYLIQRHGGGRLAMTPDRPEYADYLFWFHYANASMLPMAMRAMLSGAAASDSPAQQARARAMAERDQRVYDMIERQLGENAYFAGNEFTAADIMMTFTLTTMRAAVPRDFGRSPNTRAYLHRIGARSAYVHAMQKAEPGRPLNLS